VAAVIKMFTMIKCGKFSRFLLNALVAIVVVVVVVMTTNSMYVKPIIYDSH
jgi:hypothetical protein